jgi:hypothetical protein
VNSGQLVEVRCQAGHRSVGAESVGAQRIDDDKHDVGRLRLAAGRQCQQGDTKRDERG